MTALIKELRGLWHSRQKEVQTQFRRTLPFADYIVDRWEKAQSLGFGSGSSVYDSCLILGDVQVGENTWIGPFTVLDGSGGTLTIGANCSISAGVQIYTHDTVQRSLSGGKYPIQVAPTVIGSNTYIGPNAIICKGVTIGRQVVIGASTLVNKDISDRRRVYGSPGRDMGDVDDLCSEYL